MCTYITHGNHKIDHLPFFSSIYGICGKFVKSRIAPTWRSLLVSKIDNDYAIAKLISCVHQDVNRKNRQLIYFRKRSQLQNFSHIKEKFTIFEIYMTTKCMQKDI